jgi:hypothetical protein
MSQLWDALNNLILFETAERVGRIIRYQHTAATIIRRRWAMASFEATFCQFTLAKSKGIITIRAESVDCVEEQLGGGATIHLSDSKVFAVINSSDFVLNAIKECMIKAMQETIIDNHCRGNIGGC